MRRLTDMTIDESKCTGCGRCVKVCPSDTLALKENKAVVVGPWSMGCGHCVAVCPENAIRIHYPDDDALAFETFQGDDSYVKPGEFDVASLVRLMRSRRSFRDFGPDSVPRSVLNDLVRIGTTAPSGTNSQLWSFTLLPDREAVAAFSHRIGLFFRKLNKMAESRFARGWSKLFMRDVLGQYYREYYESVKEGIRQFEQEGRDRLFFNAPAVILIGSEPGASCPSEDALLATQNIVLAAHAMGYGTCLIGFAVEALKNDPSIKEFLGIPRKEPIYAVIAIGKAKERYLKTTGRRKVTPRVFVAPPQAASTAKQLAPPAGRKE